MDSKTCSSLARFLTLYLLFFALASACDCGCEHGSCHDQNKPPKLNPNHSGGSCHCDALKFGVCANVLNGLLDITLSQPPVTPCCSLLHGLADLDAAKCLCTALKANILGTNLHLPTSLSLLFNACQRKVPLDFQCA